MDENREIHEEHQIAVIECGKLKLELENYRQAEKEKAEKKSKRDRLKFW